MGTFRTCCPRALGRHAPNRKAEWRLAVNIRAMFKAWRSRRLVQVLFYPIVPDVGEEAIPQEGERCGMRVMVITHDQGRRHKVSEFLRQRGYEVQVPPSRHDVVPLARETQPEVLILDMYVSDPNGVEVLKPLRGVG